MCFPPAVSADGREDVDGARLQRDDGALGVLALTGAEAGAAGRARAVRRRDGLDLHAEDLLHGELDLGLVRAGVHEERVLALVDQAVALLGDDRTQDDVPRVLVVDGAGIDGAHAETSSTDEPLAAMNASRAAGVKTRSSLFRTSYAFSWSTYRTSTCFRLRMLFSATVSPRSRPTSWRLPFRVASSAAAAAFVEGTPPRSSATWWMRPARARSERAPSRAAAIIFLGVRCE